MVGKGAKKEPQAECVVWPEWSIIPGLTWDTNGLWIASEFRGQISSK